MKKHLQKPTLSDVSRNEKLAPDARPAKRKLGALKGHLHVKEDFDELPPAIVDAMEGN